MPPSNSIKKFWLFAPTLVAVLLALAVSAFLDYKNSCDILYATLCEEQISLANHLGRSVAESVAVARRNAAMQGRSSATLDLLHNYDNPDFKIDPRLRGVLVNLCEETPELNNVSVVDRTGETRMDALGVVANSGDRDYFVRAREGNGEGFATQIISLRTGKRGLFYVKPIFDHGQFIGVVRVAVDLDAVVHGWLRSLPQEREYRFRVVSEQGEIVYSSVEGENDTSVRDQPFGVVFDAPPETLLAINDGHVKKGRLVLMVKAPLEEITLHVIVGINKSSVFSRVNERSFYSLLINGATAILVIFVVLFTLNRLSTRLQSLKSAYQHSLALANAELENTIATRTDELNSERTLLRTMLDSIPDVVFYKSPDGIYLACNAALAKFWERPTSEILGKTDGELFNIGSDTQKFIDEDRRTIETRQVLTIDDEVVNPQGERFYLETLKAPCIDTSGKVLGVLGIVRDVTKRRTMEQELAVSREQLEIERSLLRTMLDSIPDVVFYKSPDGIYLTFNIALEKLVGKTTSEIYGKNDLEVFNLKSDVQKFVNQDRHIIETHQVMAIEEDVVDVNGNRFNFETYKAPCIDSNGQVLGVLGIGRDVTKRKTMERELVAAREKALAASRAKSDFLANMSHEIRTPMNGILGLSHLVLQDGSISSKTRDYVSNIDSSAKLLLHIINDILDFSKIEAGKLDVESVPFNLESVLESVIQPLLPEVSEKGLKFVYDLEPDLPKALIGDPTRLGQVILNLVGNAIKFTHEGSVTIRVQSQSRHSREGGNPQDEVVLKFDVIDTGIGLSSEKSANLFDAFTQADTSSTRRYGGTGLGLSICKNLVRLMGGEIGVESELGKGTTFSFSIKFGRQAESEDDSTGPETSTISPRPLKGKRVLLAEDNPINQIVAKGLLISYGCVVTTAGNGLEAVKQVQSQQFDVVLMDIQMPELDGMGATQRIRENPQFSKLPIIAMTAHAMVGDAEKSLSAGMQAHITKPIDPKILYTTLVKWVVKE